MPINIEIPDELAERITREAVAEKLKWYTPDPWLTCEDAAAYMKLAVDTVWALIRSNKIEYGLAGKNKYRIRQSACDAYLTRKQRTN
jgi:excisionase family DNA binding protein